MRLAAIAVISLACLFAIEGQSGSHATPLPENFNRVRSLHSVKTSAPLTSIRVTTWNIDHGANLDQIASEMTRHSADLCLLQEVDRTPGVPATGMLPRNSQTAYK